MEMQARGQIGETSTCSYLLLSQLAISGTEAIFSRFTMTSMTGAWYNPLTPFEVIFLCLVVLQIFVLRYLQILPISLTDYIQTGVLNGKKRKKRRIRGSQWTPGNGSRSSNEMLGEDLLRAIRKLDQEDCFLQSICLLGSLQNTNHNSSLKYQQLPKGITWMLNSLKKSGQERRAFESIHKDNNVTIVERPILAVFEDAVDVAVTYGQRQRTSLGIHETTQSMSVSGSHVHEHSACFDDNNNYDDYDSNNRRNRSNMEIEDEGNFNFPIDLTCARRYSLCSLSVNDTLSYIGNILNLFI